jgi:DNA polymerase-3 subunit alpha
MTFRHKQDFNTHRLLRAIDTNNILSKLPLSEQAAPDELLYSHQELYNAFAPYPHIIANTVHILNSCHIVFEYGKFANKNLQHYTGNAADDIQLLRHNCEEGLRYRYRQPSAEVFKRMEKELDIIQQMNFASYFLINWDIVRYAQSKDYYYVGRGSGANSMVAYLLRITDVDPIDLDLYFERFINPYRSNPPDFDIDFSWTDRDDITRYIFERFGAERTALLGAYNTFQHDAVIRELGKVFGLPPGEIDKLQMASKFPDIDELGKMVLRYSDLIKGFPSHLSIHSSGIIISQEPVTAYSATFMPPKGYPTTQFSMLEAEDIGLYKFDILSQRGLAKIKDAIDLVKENAGVTLDVHNMAEYKDDDRIKAMLREGKTMGCFYVESPAMRMLLSKLRADDYLRLVAASSIIRPGVSKSGMMREYILRYRHAHLREKARKELPELYNLLEETYGVMVYQEDVIKVAHFFAGLTLAEADYLRRGMSWKFKQRNEFDRVQKQFFDNCLAKGYGLKVISDIWLQIESFANYAFSKGHSASYAVESYQALYIKAYYPLEYMVATLNNGGGFYRREFYLHEARRHGAEIELPCVNNSGSGCVIKGKVIYLGFGFVNEMEEGTVHAILKARWEGGVFADVDDFLKRVPVSVEQMRLLVRVGAFRFTGKNKRQLLWEIHALVNPEKKRESELFDVKPRTWQFPELTVSELDEAFDEIELLGFSLSPPFRLLKEPLPSHLTAAQLSIRVGKEVTAVGYLVTVKPTYTSKKEKMYFGTFIDVNGDWLDTVHFPP